MSSSSPQPLQLPEQPSRVALVITDLEVGGAEKCLTQLALHLDRQRFLPEVFVLQGRPPAAKASFVQQLEAAGVPMTFLDARSISSFPRVVWRLRGCLAKFKPQLVQTFLYHANVVGTVAARWGKVPAIATGLRVAD